MPSPKTLLAFDYGTRHMGYGPGPPRSASARELKGLKARDGVPEWSEIDKLLKEWQPDLLLVGLPLNMDDSESELSVRARKFANRLHGRFGLPVELVDERLSSFEAKGEVMNRGGPRDYKNHPVDSIAARLILEDWLGRH